MKCVEAISLPAMVNKVSPIAGGDNHESNNASRSLTGVGGRVDQVSRLVEFLAKLQGQMDRLGQIQAESVSTIGKLSTSVLQLSYQVSEVKSRLGAVENQLREQGDRLSWSSAGTNGALDNPPLTPAIDPLTLFSDPLDFLGGPLASCRRGCVLVVEDDVAYQWLVRKHLEAKGIDCVLALNAQEALARLRESPRAFDLILMDIQLPGGASGLDTARRIRSFDSITPIVSMTSAVAPRQIASYLAGGMNDVLPKPFSRDGLLSLVARFCSTTLGNDIPKSSQEGGHRGSCIEEIFSGVEDNSPGGNSAKSKTFIFGQSNPSFSF